MAISVVIPMYNAEKYIGAMLDSLLAQTFQDFEVIICDDCSTDNSCAVVESYMEKFNGRLKLSHTKKNSGGPGAPTNKAISHACGKYIYQVDNDDLLMSNTLEVLYNSAENFKAEVVYMSSIFSFTNNPEKIVPNLEDLEQVKGSIVEPIFESENCGERIKRYCKDTSVVGWRRFVRRDFLVENEIILPEDIKASQDIMWTIALTYYAQKILRIPEPLYIQRKRSDSVSRSNRLGAEGVEYRGNLLVKNIEWLCKFFCKEKFFQENPQYGWMLLDWLERRYSKSFNNYFSSIPAYRIQKILENLFVKEFGEHGEIISALCASVYTGRYREKKHLEKIKNLNIRVKELEHKIENLTQKK